MILLMQYQMLLILQTHFKLKELFDCTDSSLIYYDPNGIPYGSKGYSEGNYRFDHIPFSLEGN